MGDRNPDRVSRASLRLPVAPNVKQEAAESVQVKRAEVTASAVAERRRVEAAKVKAKAAAKAAAKAKAEAEAAAKVKAAAKAKAAKELAAKEKAAQERAAQERAAKAKAARAADAARAAAAAKEKAREQAAQRAAQAAVALTSNDSGTAAQYREYAKDKAAKRGWGPTEFGCLDAIWTQESQWKVDADNPKSDAYGIPQALPGSKMSTAGSDWATNYRTQIDWGLGYIDGRYGTPCKAWQFKTKTGWY